MRIPRKAARVALALSVVTFLVMAGAPAAMAVVDTGTIEVIKVDAGDPQLRLPGAVFDVFGPGGDPDPIATLTTGPDGTAQLTDLPLGAYSIAERTAPEGYQLDTNPLAYNLFSPGTVTRTVENTRLVVDTGTIEVIKVDAGDPQLRLPGAVFDVFGPGGDPDPIATLTTGPDGTAHLTDLPLGAYSIAERTAPEGYQLDTNPLAYNLFSPGTVTRTVENTRLAPTPTPVPTSAESGTPTPTLPATGSGANAGLLALAAITLLSGGLLWAGARSGARRSRKA